MKGEISYIITPDAEVLLRQARLDPEALIHRYLGGDLGEPTRITTLMNAQIESHAEQLGRYELEGYGVIIVRRRRSGMVCVMDGASVLPYMDGL